MSKLEDAVDRFNKNSEAKMALGPYDRSVFIKLPVIATGNKEWQTWKISWNDIDGVIELKPEKPSWEDFTSKMKEETAKKKTGEVV